MQNLIETTLFQKIYKCNCKNKYDIHPYNITLDPGTYRIELWGASGGGIYANPGKGGYARADIEVEKTTTYYLYIGGEGESSNHTVASGGCNGGGDGYYGEGVKEGRNENSGGGGATDIRTAIGDLSTRILVASGGGGTSIGYPGGDGGGEVGFDGSGWNGNFTVSGGGATQQNGGKGGTYNDKIAENGTLGVGSDGVGDAYCSSGGGGGYYGGGGAYESGGGGGSGFIKSTLSGILKSGRDRFPSPTKKGYENGHIGDGYARISIITPYMYVTAKNCRTINFHLLTMIFLISKSSNRY